jgi:hypothetical protein
MGSELPVNLTIEGYEVALTKLLEILRAPGTHPTNRILDAIKLVEETLLWRKQTEELRQKQAFNECVTLMLTVSFRKDGKDSIVTVVGDGFSGSGFTLADALDGWKGHKIREGEAP